MLAPIFKMLAVLACMALLIRRKVPVGYVLLIDTVFAAVLFRMTLSDAYRAVWVWGFWRETLYLIGVMILIIGMGNMMKAAQRFDRTIKSLEALLADSRAVMAVIPAIIGLLPMPGGALLSAPMVGTAARNTRTSAARKVAINFWFRHVWEYIWPLYPGVILTADLLKIPMRNISALNLPLSGAAILGGIVFCFRGVVPPRVPRDNSSPVEHVRQLVLSLWPIIFIVVASLVIGINLLLSLGIVSAGLLLIHRFNKEQLRAIVRKSVTAETITLILGVKLFQAIIEHSGAAVQVVASFVSMNIPAALLVCVVPFVIGILTGITMAYIGVTFPVLMPFFLPDGGEIAYAYLMLAYAAGFIGVLLSPVHLCLVLTRDYFNADFGHVYRLLLPPALTVLLVAVVWFLLGARPFIAGSVL